MRIQSMMGSLLAGVIAALASVGPSSAGPLTTATLEPSQITLGEAAQLTITSATADLQIPRLPEVPGLEFRFVGQGHRMEIVNGASFASTSLIVRVTADAPGIYTIPALTPNSQPLVLRVNPDNGSASNRFNGTAAGAGPPVSSNSEGMHLAADGAAFVRLILPKRDVYVGESIPVEIEVGMRDGFVHSLNGLPTLTGGEFTFNNLSTQPERTEKIIDGKPFTLLKWHSVLSPVKPGQFSLSVESPLTVKVLTRPRRDSSLEDMLGDPFLQNFFGGSVRKDITVTSAPTELKVLPLPTADRPADFSGAVGSFQIASELSATQAAAGDPLSLKLRVTGSGNFDRVDTPMLERLSEWKTYPPRSTFKAGDATGYRGEKTFEQPIIAAEPGVQTLPPLRFTYFDPTTRRYVTAHTAPLTVDIAPAAAQAAPAAGASPGAALSARNGAAAPRDSTPRTAAAPAGLRADHAVADATARSLQPLALQPRFLLLPSLLALGFAGGWLRHERDAARARGQSAPRPTLSELERAAQEGDAALFFKLTRSVLLDAATRPGAAADTPQLLALADEAAYAGRRVLPGDYAYWLELLRRRLSEETPA